MKLINFDAAYERFAEQWIRENRGLYKNMDEMEAHLPDMFLRWLNAPADYIGGATPGTYFAQYNDPEELVLWLREYANSDVPVPDLLLERMVEIGDPSIAPLLALAGDEGADSALRVTAINLLIELNAREPMALCLDLVTCRAEEDELADVAAELLASLGHAAVSEMLARLDGASAPALATFLDLLCNFPGDERIYTYTLSQFQRGENRALYASYLAKLNDARAIEPLSRALNLTELNYLEYIEIRNAIEALGGEVGGAEREFAGDPYYESLRKMQ